jgi:hypothetical protein
MGETIIVFTLLSEIREKRADIALPKLYDAQGDERQENQTARLCLLEDTTDFGLPDNESLEENLYYVQHAGSTEATKKRQSEQLSQFASSKNKKLFRYNKNFSHLPGDRVWDCIADICSDKPSVNKGGSLAALAKHIKESYFCRSLDDIVALVWLSDIDQSNDPTYRNRFDKILFANMGDKRKLLALAEGFGFVKMRLEAEKLWLEHQGGGAVL